MRYLLIFTALITSVTSVNAGMRVETSKESISWRSSAGSEENISKEIEELYLNLYNTRNLRVRSVINSEGLLVEALLRKNEVIRGKYFPQGIDAMVCDLNPKICQRPRIPVKRADLQKSQSHLGGYAISAPKWTFSQGAEIIIPDYRFEPYTTLKTEPVPLDWKPSDWVPPADVDCSAWGASCSDLVVKLNPGVLSKSGQASRSAVLPVSGLETSLPIIIDEQSKAGEIYNDLGDAPAAPNDTLYAEPEAQQVAPAWRRKQESSAPDADELIEVLRPKTRSIGRVTKFGVEEEPAYSTQLPLFQLIHHPFATGEDLDPQYGSPVEVAVLDSDYQDGHCDLPSEDAASAAARPDCGVLLSNNPNPLHDHANHVIGIIAAPMNGMGIVGLDPAARIKFEEIDLVLNSKERVDALVNTIVKLAISETRVVNMSWGYTPSIGSGVEIENAIDAMLNKALVVAAAGNDKAKLEAGCGMIPACLFDRDNVITVAGLDDNPDSPQIWTNETSGSNFGPEVSIAAVAQNVLSTVRDNKLGKMSGTSQAAPQVAAAAALIYSAAESIYEDEIRQTGGRLAPKLVKARLIYTADPFLKLSGKVLSGRLNIARAIDIVPTQLVVADGDGQKAYEGTLTKIPTDTVLCEANNSVQIAFDWKSIRRMIFDKVSNRYIVFKNIDPADRSSKLIKEFCWKLVSRTNKGKLELADRSEVEFELRSVLDYTSPMFNP